MSTYNPSTLIARSGWIETVPSLTVAVRFTFFGFLVRCTRSYFAGAKWQRLINDILFEYLNDFCAVYLDDILVYSNTLKEYKEQVNKVLDKLIKAGLQVDIEKSKFYVQETTFLEVIVSINSIRMDLKKIQAIVD